MSRIDLESGLYPEEKERLMRIIAEEIQAPSFPADEYQEFVGSFGGTVDSVVKVTLMALKLYEDTQDYLDKLFSGTRAVPKNNAVSIIGSRYLEG